MPTPAINRQQARELDRLAIEQYGISGLVLMENAGRGVADQLCQLGIDGPVVICCGPGNNGGDGFVLARHLDLRGHAVRVLLCGAKLIGGRPDLKGDAAVNFNILQKCNVPIQLVDGPAAAEADLTGASWIVDALLGTGFRGEPRPPLDMLIDSMNRQPAPILAIDVPSGLDCDTGQASTHTVRAAHTCTFVAPKVGFFASGASDYVGQVHVLDIGAPRRLIEEMLSELPRN